ncbi:MAG: hypothetical protein M1837_002760 [Sclerophora amabilis]|nr:MAG: hypothetical protein M1837_002760 [Sclerophora amabilis]
MSGHAQSNAGPSSAGTGPAGGNMSLPPQQQTNASAMVGGGVPGAGAPTNISQQNLNSIGPDGTLPLAELGRILRCSRHFHIRHLMMKPLDFFYGRSGFRRKLNNRSRQVEQQFGGELSPSETMLMQQFWYLKDPHSLPRVPLADSITAATHKSPMHIISPIYAQLHTGIDVKISLNGKISPAERRRTFKILKIQPQAQPC